MMHLSETNLKNWVQGKRLSWYEKNKLMYIFKFLKNEYMSFSISILKPAFYTHHYSRLRTQTTFFLLIVFVIKNNPPIHINNVKNFANKSVTHPPFAKSDTICLKEMESKLEI